MLLFLTLIDNREDQDKFDLIYHQYRHAMFKIAYGVTHDVGQAEDAVQLAFLKIARNMHRLGDIDARETKSLILLIVKHTALDSSGKRQSSSSTQRSRPVVVSLDEAGGEMACADLAPDNILIDQETYLALEQEIMAMRPTLADVLVLRYVHNLNDREIAELLQISHGAVRTRLHEARKQLARRLEGKK